MISDMEYFFPMSDGSGVKVLRELFDREDCHKEGGLCPYGFGEVRFVAKNDIMISPQYQQDTLVFSSNMFPGYDANSVHCHHEIEKLALAHGGRPHYGKRNFVNAAQLRKMYPKFQQFLDIHKQLDPQGVFANDYVKQRLLSE